MSLNSGHRLGSRAWGLTLACAVSLAQATSLSPISLPNFAPPPARPSVEERADLQELLSWQKKRTPAECARARSEVVITIASYFGEPYGPLSAADLQKSLPLFERIHTLSHEIVGELKQRFSRKRPAIQYPELKPCVPIEVSGSYPSGHSALASAEADLLGELFPAKKAELDKRARQIALDRVIGGVHYPSDINSGLQLGHDLYRELKKSAEFSQTVARTSKQFSADLRP